VRRRVNKIAYAAGAFGLAGCTGLVSGCASPAAAGASPSCGTTKTAAGVPVIIKIAKGSVSCGTALSVENQYAALIKSGHVQGNGGGAPVSVAGWTCQGYPTPEVLRTGDASQCHEGGAQILAVLPLPSGTGTASPTASA
jgi:hypothetical protein